MNKGHGTFTAGLLLAGILSAGMAHASPIYTHPITLTGANEVPSNLSTATGSGTITIDISTRVVSWDITQNVSNATAAHIHGPAGAGFNAAIFRPLYAGSVPGHMVGSYTIGRTPIDTLGWILHDSTYVNIHSVAFSGGEIRGQIPPVPSLSEWGIILLSLLLAAAGIGFMRRRRSAVA